MSIVGPISDNDEGQCRPSLGMAILDVESYMILEEGEKSDEIGTLSPQNENIDLGRIPSGNQLQTLNGSSIYVGNPQLCGPPITKNCPGDATSEGPVPVGNDEAVDDDGFEMFRFYVSMEPGFVVGFWGVWHFVVKEILEDCLFSVHQRHEGLALCAYCSQHGPFTKEDRVEKEPVSKERVYPGRRFTDYAILGDDIGFNPFGDPFEQYIIEFHIPYSLCAAAVHVLLASGEASSL
ncbi:hypothetical protein HHK36_023294 [Tetracentron sinense]|uniref:Uncharacterized protein n=1 Tax=Tetracentron sinense TaxID=13715 RepID=A0A835D8J6_TETSI|nr:hypothetical protein HHK36_023294 [Tetracentron sinense]